MSRGRFDDLVGIYCPDAGDGTTACLDVILSAKTFIVTPSNLNDFQSVSGWDTSRVTDMNGVFRDCSSLVTLDFSGWDTTRVTNMAEMFSGCHALTSLDLSRFDTTSVEKMWFMFYSCTSLTSITLGEGFAFCNPKGDTWRSMPYGVWVSASDGTEYDCRESIPNPIPNNVADTYTLKETMSNVEGATILGR